MKKMETHFFLVKFWLAMSLWFIVQFVIYLLPIY